MRRGARGWCSADRTRVRTCGGLRFVDSTDEARVQVADILGGVGREAARLATTGVFDDELQVLASEMLDYNVMCSTG